MWYLDKTKKKCNLLKKLPLHHAALINTKINTKQSRFMINTAVSTRLKDPVNQAIEYQKYHFNPRCA